MDFRILIVDDDRSIHDAIRDVLHTGSFIGSKEIESLREGLFNINVDTPRSESINYTISSAYQAEEALKLIDQEYLNKTPFALVIMDSRMPPGIDGPAAIEKIFNKYNDIEIILLTAYSDLKWEDILKRIKYKDQFIYLKKPFDVNVLRQIVSMFASTHIKVKSIKKQLDKLNIDLVKRTKELNDSVEDIISIEGKKEDALNLKHEFISTISHELRTPLTAAISIMKAFEKTELNDDQSMYLKIVNETHEILLNILDNILDFSRLENDNLNLYIIEFDYKKLVQLNIQQLMIQAEEKGNKITLSIDDKIPDKLIGDPAKIRQIYTNLIGNAIKFTQNGKIDIVVELLNENEDSATVLTSIVDTGIGINSNKYEKIFETFSQGDSSIQRIYGGAGIGLNVSKKLVKKMNGEIGVASKLNEGSNFSFHIVLKKWDDHED